MKSITKTDIEKAIIKLGFPEDEYDKLPERMKELVCIFFLVGLCQKISKELASLQQKADKRDDQ